MLKVAIENSYTNTYNWKDKFWNRFFMQEFFKKKWIELTRVSINKLNKKNEFSEYNIFNKKWNSETIKKAYKPDILQNRKWTWIFYKYSKLDKIYKIIPSKKISIISNDKFETYLFCKNHQPKTFLLSSFFLEKDKEILSNKIVIKPIRANWWKWINLTTTNELHKNKNKFSWLEELYIVQEFKDFSKWYPWITNSTHDVRLMFAWNKIIEATLRTPKKWDFKSNIWSWWTQHILEKNKLPKELIILSKEIYKKLELKWNDIMSMDFAYCKKENKRYLIEINASPGTRYYQENQKELEKICKWLISFFKWLKK